VQFLVVNVLFVALTYLLFKGTGIWGINIPVGWGFAIVNFVWWIGIGHAGTLISAILLLLKQTWRTSMPGLVEWPAAAGALGRAQDLGQLLPEQVT